jgi:hypothetical protein
LDPQPNPDPQRWSWSFKDPFMEHWKLFNGLAIFLALTCSICLKGTLKTIQCSSIFSCSYLQHLPEGNTEDYSMLKHFFLLLPAASAWRGHWKASMGAASSLDDIITLPGDPILL